MKRSGFTLAELLIALVILGVIATFTIPKILQSQQDSKRKSVFREVFSALSDIQYQGFRSNFDGQSAGAYIYDHLNAVKKCPGDSSAQGCWDTGIQGTYGNWITFRGVTMHNGARLVGLSDWDGDLGGGVHCASYMFDWNGLEGPNTYGNDQIDLITAWGPVMDTNPVSWCYNVKPGTVAVNSGTLQNQMFGP